MCLLLNHNGDPEFGHSSTVTDIVGLTGDAIRRASAMAIRCEVKVIEDPSNVYQLHSRTFFHPLRACKTSRKLVLNNLLLCLTVRSILLKQIWWESEFRFFLINTFTNIFVREGRAPFQLNSFSQYTTTLVCGNPVVQCVITYTLKFLFIMR